MEPFLLASYFLVAAWALVQAALTVLQGWENRRFARSRMAKLDRDHPTMRVALIAPCKGVDVGMRDNLARLLDQDYHNYEVHFVVETRDDPACPVIEQVMAEHPKVASRLVAAGRAEASGQKVHNLLAAVARLAPGVEILAFVDSDARPRRQWLRRMIARLRKKNVGAVTGYRWFVPERPSMANHLVYAINARVAGLFGPGGHYLIWGGSWAIRREVFERLRLREAWQRVLDEDLVAARRIHEAGLRIEFEPAAMVPSPLELSPRQMGAFLRRQYLLTRLYAPKWWTIALLASTIATFAFWGSLAVAGWAAVAGSSRGWVAAGVGAALYGLSVLRGWLRRDLVGGYFPELREKMRAAGRFDIWAGPVVGLVNWISVLASSWGRVVAWRAVRYQLHPNGTVRAIERDEVVEPRPRPVPDHHARPRPVLEPAVSRRKAV